MSQSDSGGESEIYFYIPVFFKSMFNYGNIYYKKINFGNYDEGLPHGHFSLQIDFIARTPAAEYVSYAFFPRWPWCLHMFYNC